MQSYILNDKKLWILTQFIGRASDDVAVISYSMFYKYHSSDIIMSFIYLGKDF